MKKWDVVIIGSGISSLTCAALLSKKGKAVCVLERYVKPGGYLHCFNRFGMRFDTGAHYVGAMQTGQPFHALLNYLGAFDESLFTPLDKDGFDVLKFPKFTVELPQGYNETIERLSEKFPMDSEAIRKYFSLVREAASKFPTYNFNEDADQTSMMKFLDVSLADVVTRLTNDPRLQCVLYAYCALHGVNPEDVSFGMHAILADSLIIGAHGFSKGGDALAEKFVEVIKKNGGEIQLRKHVTRIETANGLATAVVTTDGAGKEEKFEADWVISGIHPKSTFNLVDDQRVFTPAFKARVERVKESIGVFGVYAKCETETKIDPLKNYYYFKNEDPSGLLDSEGPSSKPSGVFLSSSNRLAGRSTNVPVTIHATSPVEWFRPFTDSRYGKRPAEYKELKESYARQIVNFVDEYEPGFKDGVNQYVTSTPVTNLHFNGSVDGSSYGIYHSMENTGARSLGPRTHVANLLLTGQSCLFPGLLGSAIAGLRSSGHVIGIKPLLKELRESGRSR